MEKDNDEIGKKIEARIQKHNTPEKRRERFLNQVAETARFLYAFGTDSEDTTIARAFFFERRLAELGYSGEKDFALVPAPILKDGTIVSHETNGEIEE